MFKWLKHAFFKGLIVLIPIVLLWVTLRELVELLVTFAEPIAEFLPPDTLEWIEEPEFVAPILIVLFALLLGGLASISMVRKAGAWLEGHTLGYLPFYRMIKTFIAAFLEVENTSSFRPALILDDEGGAEPCYIIEESEDYQNVVVLVPWSPASFAGSVRLVPQQRIRRLDISFDELSLKLANFGLGMNSVLKHPDSAGTDKQE